MAENFPNQRRKMTRHIVIKLTKINDKEKLLKAAREVNEREREGRRGDKRRGREEMTCIRALGKIGRASCRERV